MPTPSLFLPGETGLESVSEHWLVTKDGDPRGLELYEQHYSCHHYRDKRVRKLFCGPGQKTVLISPCGRALFVWRKFKDDSGQEGVNCAVFRYEGGMDVKASDLIREAEQVAWKRWPGERLYTYVDPGAVQTEIAGYCFRRAGWKSCGFTKVNKLLILAKSPRMAKPRKRGLNSVSVSVDGIQG